MKPTLKVRGITLNYENKPKFAHDAFVGYTKEFIERRTTGRDNQNRAEEMQLYPVARTNVIKRKLPYAPTTVEMLKLGAPRNKKSRITESGATYPFGFCENPQ